MENRGGKRKQSAAAGEEVNSQWREVHKWETQEQSAYQLSKDIFLGLKNVRFCLKRFKCLGQRMQTQQGNPRTTEGRNKVLRARREKNRVTKWPKPLTWGTLKFWVTSGYMLLNYQCWENKRMFGHFAIWSHLYGKLLKGMHATKGGTNQERDGTGHRTSIAWGESEMGYAQKRAEEGLHSCPSTHFGQHASQQNHRLYQQWMAELKAPNRNNWQKLHDF